MENHREQEECHGTPEVNKKQLAGQTSVSPGDVPEEKSAGADPLHGQTPDTDPLNGQIPGSQGEEDDPRLRDCGVESQVPRLPPSRPKMPPKQEREGHEATGHACYRSWCEHCVAARARGQYHRGTDEECELPEVAVDYGYMTKEDTKCLPMICARHRDVYLSLICH